MTGRAPEPPRGRHYPFRDRAVAKFVRPLDEMVPLTLQRRRPMLLIAGAVFLTIAMALRLD